MSYFDQPPERRSLLPPADEIQSLGLSAEEVALARTLLGKLVRSGADDETDTRPRRKTSALELAKSVYLSRKRRVEHFGPVLFSEPAWDMLLVLYVYGDGGDQLSVTRLAEFSQSPLTTAIRWLDYLESQRMIVRSQCQHDRRKLFVELSAKGRASMEDYFSGLLSTLTLV